MLSEIADNLEEDLKRTGYSARTVVVKYKVSHMRWSMRKSIGLTAKVSFHSVALI